MRCSLRPCCCLPSNLPPPRRPPHAEGPRAQECSSGAKVIDRITPAGGGPEVELRNSTRCSAAWARIQRANSSWRFRLQIRGGATYTANASPSYAAYTQMAGSSTAYSEPFHLRLTRVKVPGTLTRLGTGRGA
ncbi:DUF2690 domain-containing protein [Actinacidiphila glaucinigra]|uniref:DUF2690 domain-containing protein n=1 Tax=Actinacidiphila glaucinigra TaxID=235986 RepID=UPI0036736399